MAMTQETAQLIAAAKELFSNDMDNNSGSDSDDDTASESDDIMKLFKKITPATGNDMDSDSDDSDDDTASESDDDTASESDDNIKLFKKITPATGNDTDSESNDDTDSDSDDDTDDELPLEDQVVEAGYELAAAAATRASGAKKWTVGDVQERMKLLQLIGAKVGKKEGKREEMVQRAKELGNRLTQCQKEKIVLESGRDTLTELLATAENAAWNSNAELKKQIKMIGLLEVEKSDMRERLLKENLKFRSLKKHLSEAMAQIAELTETVAAQKAQIQMLENDLAKEKTRREKAEKALKKHIKAGHKAAKQRDQLAEIGLERASKELNRQLEQQMQEIAIFRENELEAAKQRRKNELKEQQERLNDVDWKGSRGNVSIQTGSRYGDTFTCGGLEASLTRG